MTGGAKRPKHRFRSRQTAEINGIRHIFQQAWPSSTNPNDFRAEPEYLFLRERDYSPITISEDKLDYLIGEKQFRALSPADERRKLPRIAPTGPKDPKALARQFWCERYDENPVPHSEPALKRFIQGVCEQWKDTPEFPKVFIPKCWTLRRWVKERGVPGCRPLAAMDRRESPTRETFPPLLEKIIAWVVAWFWSARPREKYDAYNKLTALVLYLNRRRRRKDPSAVSLPVPDLSTIYRRINKAESHFTWTAKYDKDAADKRFNGVRSGLSASRLLEKVVVDSTPGDTLLALDTDRMEILGPATFEVAFDVKTRVIVGATLTFEEPSLYTVMAVLKRVVLPKTDLIAARPELKDTLEPYGKPGTIIVDNAWEQVGKSFQDALEDAQIDVIWAPKETPEYKAIVERGIQTITRKLFHKAPGGIPFPAYILRKLGIDPRKTAVLSLHEIEEMLLDAIDDYHRQRHDGIGMPPIEAWRRECQIHGIETLSDPDFLDAAFGEVFDVSISREGVLLEGIRYHDETKTSLLLERLAPVDSNHLKRRTSIFARAKAKRNPADLTELHIWNRRDKEYVTLPAKDANPLLGLNRQQTKLIKNFALSERIPFNTDEDKARARLRLVNKLEAALPGMKLAARRKQRALLSEPPRLVSGTKVLVRTIQPRHDGMEVVQVPTAYGQRSGTGNPVRGIRRGGAAATRKAVRHREKSAAVRAAEAAVERTKTSGGPEHNFAGNTNASTNGAGTKYSRTTATAFPKAEDATAFVRMLRKKGWGAGSTGDRKA
jgi:putative transposase